MSSFKDRVAIVTGGASGIGQAPRVRIPIPEAADLGAEILRWQVAVAMASAVIGVHPFNQPDVQLAKKLAQQAVRGETGAEPPPVVAAADTEHRDQSHFLDWDAGARQ